MSKFLDKLKEQIKMHEGVETVVYLDTEGIETIGVGRNLKDRGLLQIILYPNKDIYVR